MQESEYYVYIYLDPRKPGDYRYGQTRLQYEPFYVGKGKGRRKAEHLFESSLKKSNASPKVAKIRKILSLNLSPIIQIIHENLNEDAAYALEDGLIREVGSDFINEIPDGPLTNMKLGLNPPSHRGKTYLQIYGSEERAEFERRSRHERQLEAGGFFKGRSHTEDTKRRISEKSRANQARGGFRTGILHDDDTKRKMSERQAESYRSNRRYYKLENTSTGEVVETVNIQETCNKLNLSKSTLEKSFREGRPVKRGKTAGWQMVEVRQAGRDEWETYQNDRSVNASSEKSCDTPPMI